MQVTFRYPNSQHLALDNFTLSIYTEEIIAIVGENGSGKSTFIKLMCRFYDPLAGRITIDGKDIRELPLTELYDLITVQFQLSVHYHDTAANNIAISSITAPATRQQIEAVAKATGADIPIEQLPEGYDTLLGKWFGTAELSGGQWQRIAVF